MNCLNRGLIVSVCSALVLIKFAFAQCGFCPGSNYYTQRNAMYVLLIVGLIIIIFYLFRSEIKRKKIVILAISAITVIAFSWILYISVLEPYYRLLQGSQCITAFTITYNDATKYNKTKIISSLKEVLSENDFKGKIFGPHSWLELVYIAEPINGEPAFLDIPTASARILEIVKEKVARIDGVSKVDVFNVYCRYH